jgi:hypothetical protein
MAAGREDVDLGGDGWKAIRLMSCREGRLSWRDGKTSGEKEKQVVDEFVVQWAARRSGLVQVFALANYLKEGYCRRWRLS